MKGFFDWNDEKNEELKARYGFGFEQIVLALSNGALLADRTHPNTERYGHQQQLVVELEGYAWIVPFVQADSTLFFKTMFPSRKATRLYLGREP